jgi:hypothetical protein
MNRSKQIRQRIGFEASTIAVCVTGNGSPALEFSIDQRALRRVSLRGRNEKALFRIAPCALRSTPRANVIPKFSATGKQSLRRFRQ